MPAICSRRTRLISSIPVCIARKRGTIRDTTRPMLSPSTGTATPTSQDSPTSSRRAITTPPTMLIGAATNIRHPIRTSICTCCTSLVVREIRVGAPNRESSWALNSPTRVNTAERRSRPTPIAVRAANQTLPSAALICSRLTASIQPPVRTM